MQSYAWLLLAFPLLGALINGFFGARLGKRAVSLVGTASIALSFVIAVLLFANLLGLPDEARSVTVTLWNWIQINTFQVNIGLLIDPLSTLMALIVTGVGLLIHIYSVGYMADDARYARYFTYLNGFIFLMLTLIVADNFLQMYIGWEGVGLASFALIGFWFADPVAAEASKKAFITNRVGDFGMALAVMGLWTTFGTLQFSQLNEQVAAAGPAAGAALGGITLLLLLAATGKSAQLPLFVWLPDAMAGPTPVSAPIHAATMVTAGVYMIVRNHALFEAAPGTMNLVAIVGVLTALFAATIALAQTDLKKVLAYSTISQLGYMFLAVGVGAFTSGMFHVVTHAFFKALLFLGAGSAMHALHLHEADMKRMGGLRNQIPATYRTFLIGAAALAGFPLLSGFFSKDEILLHVFEKNILLYILGLATAFLTAVYAFRAVFLTFWGERRKPEGIVRKRRRSEPEPEAVHAHESPPVMTTPLWILAVLSLVGGVIGLPRVNWIEGWMHPVVAGARAAEEAAQTGNLTLELVLLVVSALVALAGIYMAYLAYVRQPQLVERVRGALGPVVSLVEHKYYIDELYMSVIVNPLRELAGWFAEQFDRKGIDGAVNGVARLLGQIGQGARRLQTGFAGSYALSILVGVVALVGYFLLRQP